MNSFKDKRIVFFGTPDFTVEFLELFKSIGLDISLIVTGEDRPFGRGMQLKSPAPKIWAEENSIKFLQPKKLDQEFYRQLKNESWDLIIVIAYGKIIPENVINLPKFGTINLHYSLLPKYRGASPVEAAILNNEVETGLTIQQMVYKLDAGDILYQEKLVIDKEDTASILRNKLNEKAIEIFPDFLDSLFGNEIEKNKQEDSMATSCGKFKKEDLDVTKDISENNFENIWTKYKAYDKKIFFFQNNLRVKITEMSSTEISKVLPESKKEISKLEYETSFGKIFL